jgi:hypothetical protein
MRANQSTESKPGSVQTWIRQNVIDVAPLWIQFYRSAVANVRVR